jgi:hypothetical protein
MILVRRFGGIGDRMYELLDFEPLKMQTGVLLLELSKWSSI